MERRDRSEEQQLCYLSFTCLRWDALLCLTGGIKGRLRRTREGVQTLAMATAQACPQISTSCCCPNLYSFSSSVSIAAASPLLSDTEQHMVSVI